jgi:hypothetical protein
MIDGYGKLLTKKYKGKSISGFLAVTEMKNYSQSQVLT